MTLGKMLANGAQTVAEHICVAAVTIFGFATKTVSELLKFPCSALDDQT